MGENDLTIMVVDNETPVLRSIVTMLDTMGYTAVPFSSAQEAFASLEAEKDRYDVILTDINMPGIDGFRFIEMVRGSSRADIPILVLTGYGSIDSAVKAIKIGANGYYEKDRDPELLLFEIRKLAQTLRMQERMMDLEKRLEARDQDFYLFSFRNEKANALFVSAGRIASKDVSILITGESGTGKEILARWIHRRSGRRNGCFLSVNCSAVPDSLFESEMFGHRKGAFTGALGDHSGYFEQAAGGTLLMDEIGEMSIANQVKLLKVLEDGSFQPVGSRKGLRADCRTIVATNANLKEAIDKGAFRKDLYFRINTVEFVIPPLRERREDIPDFIHKYLRFFNLKYQTSIEEFCPEVRDYLVNYSWPGNIRELRHVVERCVLFARNNMVDMELLLQHGMSSSEEDGRSSSFLTRSYREAKRRFEQEYFSTILERSDGSISRIAEFSGLERSYIYRKLKELGLDSLRE